MLLYTTDGGIFKVKSKHCSGVVSQCLDAGLLQIGEPLRRSASLKSYFYMKSCYWPAASHPDQLWNTPPVVLNLCQSFFQPVVVTFSNFFFFFNMDCCHQIQNGLIFSMKRWNIWYSVFVLVRIIRFQEVCTSLHCVFIYILQARSIGADRNWSAALLNPPPSQHPT